MRIFLLIVIIFSLPSCDGHSGFGASCNEGHPAVAHARSLSKDQLKFIYEEMFRLRKTNSDTSVEYGHRAEPIPDNFKFLNAVKIQPNKHDPSIMLAGCMDEYIFLSLGAPDSKNPGIVLFWADGTSKNPYATGSQVLWKLNR